MQLRITSEFIDKIAANYGGQFIGGSAYRANAFCPLLMKGYVVLASNDELIVVSLGASGEPKSDVRYPYTQLSTFKLKNGPVSKTAIIQPNSGKKLKLTIQKKIIGMTEYQERLIDFLETKTK